MTRHRNWPHIIGYTGILCKAICFHKGISPFTDELKGPSLIDKIQGWNG